MTPTANGWSGVTATLACRVSVAGHSSRCAPEVLFQNVRATTSSDLATPPNTRAYGVPNSSVTAAATK